jgi:hypothetical protein
MQIANQSELTALAEIREICCLLSVIELRYPASSLRDGLVPEIMEAQLRNARRSATGAPGRLDVLDGSRI